MYIQFNSIQIWPSQNGKKSESANSFSHNTSSQFFKAQSFDRVAPAIFKYAGVTLSLPPPLSLSLTLIHSISLSLSISLPPFLSWYYRYWHRILVLFSVSYLFFLISRATFFYMGFPVIRQSACWVSNKINQSINQWEKELAMVTQPELTLNLRRRALKRER